MNEKLYSRIVNLCPGKNKADIVVYYFDGDCSICIAKVRYIEHKLRDDKSEAASPIFIARTANPSIFKFNLNNLGIKSCVFIDESDTFLHDLNFLHVIKVYRDHSILNYDQQMLGDQK